MTVNRYQLSFIGASIAVQECVVIAETYLSLRDWVATEKKVKSENLIQARTQSSLQRYYQELAPRLKLLSDDQLDLLVNGSLREQKHLLWYAICKRYAYIREFAIEILHEKFLLFDFALNEYTYEAFFNRKADWHEELENLKESSRIKLRTMLFRMLRDAGLVDSNHVILPAILSQRLVHTIQTDASWSLEIFPVSLAEISI